MPLAFIQKQRIEKEQVNHVSSLAKSAIWRALGTGKFLAHAKEIVKYLQITLVGHSDPMHYIKKIKALQVKQFPKNNGFPHFLVIVFKLNLLQSFRSRKSLQLQYLQIRLCDLRFI